jgi:hypothetical protein
VHPYLRRKHRKERENRDRFAALIQTPATGSFTMPANGRIRFVATAGSVEGATAATLEGTFHDGDAPVERTIRTPVLAAGGYVKVDSIEKDVVVNVEATFEAQVDMGLGKWATIAEGA